MKFVESISDKNYGLRTAVRFLAHRHPNQFASSFLTS